MNHPQFVRISSGNRTSSSTSSSQFTILLPSAINDVKSVSFAKCALPITWYNVSAALGNNTFIVNRSSTNYTYTVPDGSYNITTLMSQIQTGINALDANTYVITYSTTTFLVNISGSAAFVVKGTGLINKLLGFPTTDSSSSTSNSASSVPQLYHPETAYLMISQLGVSTTTSFANDQATFTIPISENSESIQQYDSNSNYDQIIEFLFPITLHQLDITLKMKNNQILNLNNADFDFILELEYAN